MDALETTVDMSMSEAEGVVRDALAEQGFGVLTEMDVAAILKAKLGVDRAPLKILGACNPEFANSALELDPSVALVLPCNVSLSAAGEGRTKVSIVDPRGLMDGAEFSDLAEGAADKLRAALASMEAR